jgi:Na+/melibiose symporter-like transporter
MTPVYSRTTRSKPLSFSAKLFQGLGSIPDTVKNWVLNTFALFYYSQLLGLDAFLVSVILAIAMIFDSITDPLIGAFSDNLRTRWGRRHPLMLAAALPLGLGIYLIFTPPAGLSDSWLAAWLLLCLVLTRGMMTLYFVPWAAIASELSDDYHERTSVMAHRYAVGWAIGVGFPLFVYSMLLPSTEAYPVGQMNIDAYPMVGLAAALLLTGGALATGLLTLREVPFLRQHASAPAAFSLRLIFQDLIRALKNGQFALIFVIVIMISAIGGTTTNLGLYMNTFFWGFDTDDLRWFSLSAVGAVIAFPLIALIQRRWEKKQIILLCALTSLVDGVILINLRFLDVLPQNGDPLLLVILVSMGVVAVAIAVVQGVISASLLADVLDQHELETGYRQEGMFNAALSFSGKAVSGVGIVLGGLIITLIEFPLQTAPDMVPENIIFRLGLVVGVLLPLLYLIPIALVTRLNITEAVHADIRAQLDERYQAQRSEG